MPQKPAQLRLDLLWAAVAHDRDARARQALVDAYLDLVHVVACRMHATLPRHLDERDLYGAGLVGLLQAIDQFDPERGVEFVTFAMPRIRGAMLDEVRSQDWLPRRLRRQAREIDAAHSRLENEQGRAVSLAEVADALQMSRAELEDRVHQIKARQPLSLDAPARSQPESASRLVEAVPDAGLVGVEERLAWEQRREELIRAVDDLPKREQTILRQHYFEGRRLKEIGRTLHISESRVSQLHGRALAKLRARLGTDDGTDSVARELADLLSREILV